MTPGSNIQIIHNKITIVDKGQASEGIPLTLGQNCYLTVNRKKVTGPIRITPDDDVTWHVKETSPPPFELTMSTDRLEVFLTVYENCHNKWQATIANGKDSFIINCVPEPDPTRPLSIADVVQQYRQQKFQALVDRAAIEQALKEKTAKPVVIAKGEAAVEGKNGWVEAHFPLDEDVPFEQFGDKINYREKRRIPTIRCGELMATIHPPTTGKPGTDVRGSIILPKPTHAVNCRLKHNVREDNGKIYAKITGRPSISKSIRPVVDVVPVYTVSGNVDLDSGHVRFEGDVIIHGNVMETMKVTAAQRIIVHGGVYGAELVAGASIHVEQNIRKSKLFAGLRGTFARTLHSPLKKLYEQTISADKSRKLLEEEAAKKQQVITTEEIFHHLLGHYYPDILMLAKEVLRLFENASGNSFIPEELTDVQEILDRLIFESSYRFQLSTWTALMEELRRCVDDKLAACSQSESIVTQTSDVSYLEVNGDVVFLGKGSTQSYIKASERILFTKPNASCRGGQLEAGDCIVAEGLGSLGGSKTKCRAGNRISAKSMQHCDIQIEGPPRYIEEETQIEYYREGNQTLFRHLHK